MARIRYGKTFRTRRGRHGRYKYVNGRRVGFVSSNRRPTRGRSKYRHHKSGRPRYTYRGYRSRRY